MTCSQPAPKLSSSYCNHTMRRETKLNLGVKVREKVKFANSLLPRHHSIPGSQDPLPCKEIPAMHKVGSSPSELTCFSLIQVQQQLEAEPPSLPKPG